MEIQETGLKGCVIIKPKVIEDSRGYFFEGFNSASFERLTGMSGDFVQDNQSFSSFGVIRGLHAQDGDYAQAKLVRVLQGEVLDVAVDARPDSDTYGQHFAVRLSAKNKLQLYVPRGFLHGFAVLSDTAEFFYKCDNFYNKESERGIHFGCPELNIDWLIEEDKRIIADKDLSLPFFSKRFI
ncbi:dTDP-4-dehydrorhamnose 3,5-epimerase [Pedobacter gandavensis]|uniref:dTDP-4-dehydrorhamnose 3,5-epimerase n=1 Tax=Pedobacter gandavensis TaxID=2679963 RepID=UPI00292EF1DE|nr:dTDP-4-dehydrorhamnose 3,5-epimerase [Pedobacter gandavensis]